MFLKFVQGGYAYLLIFQILVVSLLFLTLLWLMVRRVRYGALGTTMGTGEAAVNPVSAPAPDNSIAHFDTAASEKILAESARTIATLKEQVAQLQTAAANSPAPAANNPEGAEAAAPDPQLTEQNSMLEEKVKYLESKLLEYEILQEEIGTLSALKLENEQLKQRLVALEAGAPVPPAPTTPAPEPIAVATPPARDSIEMSEAKEPAASEVAPVVEEDRHEPSFEPSAEPLKTSPEPSVVGKLAAAEKADELPEGMEHPELDPRNPEVSAPTLASLESLLHQIDELTKSPPSKT